MLEWPGIPQTNGYVGNFQEGVSLGGASMQFSALGELLRMAFQWWEPTTRGQFSWQLQAGVTQRHLVRAPPFLGGKRNLLGPLGNHH
jgi:hypothetical protein